MDKRKDFYWVVKSWGIIIGREVGVGTGFFRRIYEKDLGVVDVSELRI